jgi:regulatory protein
MAGTITELRYQQRNHERVNVYLDGRFAFALPDTEAAKLKPGQQLSDADIERLKGADAEQKAYDRALRFLSYRPRSEAEVRDNLVKAGTEEPVIAEVLERLRSQGYVNDADFARFWIENRERFRPRGARALRQELRRKGVDDAASADLLAEVDLAESAYRAVYGRALRLAPLLAEERLVFRRKVSDFLLRRGYDYDVVRDVVARLERELTEDAAS